LRLLSEIQWKIQKVGYVLEEVIPAFWTMWISSITVSKELLLELVVRSKITNPFRLEYLTGFYC